MKEIETKEDLETEKEIVKEKEKEEEKENEKEKKEKEKRRRGKIHILIELFPVSFILKRWCRNIKVRYNL